MVEESMSHLRERNANPNSGWRDAWLVLSPCIIGAGGLVVKGLMIAVPYLVKAITAALD